MTARGLVRVDRTAMTSPRTVRRALVAGFATLTLGLAACGGDDSEGGDDTTATDDTGTDDSTADTATEDTASGDTTPADTATEDSVSEETTPADTASGDTLSVDDVDLDAYVAEAATQLDFADADVADCVARGIVEPLGVEQIAATGLSPEEFLEAESLNDTGVEIDDDLRLVMENQVAECGGLVEELVASQFGDDPEVAACVTTELDDQIIANVLVAGVTGGEPSAEALDAQSRTQECDPES